MIFVHAIHRYRMQNDQKGNRFPFETALKIIWALLANCQRVMEDRMQIQKIMKALHKVLH